MFDQTFIMQDLRTQYGQLDSAECDITIGGSLKIKSIEGTLGMVDIDLAADGGASMVTFTIGGPIYKQSDCDWNLDYKTYSQIKVGATVSVELGYKSRLTEVFYGYIDSVQYAQDLVAELHMTVTAVDALGFLMNRHAPVYVGEATTQDVVNQILNAAVSAGAAKSFTCKEQISDFITARRKAGISDYEFLMRLGRMLGFTLLVSAGEIIFGNLLSNTAARLQLAYQEDLKIYKLTTSLAHQPGKYVVRGYDDNYQKIVAEVMNTTLPGDGMCAAQIASSILKEAVFDEDSTWVKTPDQAMQLAQTRFDEICSDFVMIEAAVTGLPELIPGRYIEFTNMPKFLGTSFYMTRVNHLFYSNSGTFNTKITGKAAKANAV